MIVKDPSVWWSVPPPNHSVLLCRAKSSIKLSPTPVQSPEQMPGGFVDDGGVGNGGMPLGIVIKNGKLLAGSRSTEATLVGFDQKNVLHVGTMTAGEALDKGMRDAVSFGPALVINGNPAENAGSGGGLNPRTALGQRADGSVLILVIDGRQPHSLGATHKDLVDVMVQFDAINACNPGRRLLLYALL